MKQIPTALTDHVPKHDRNTRLRAAADQRESVSPSHSYPSTSK